MYPPLFPNLHYWWYPVGNTPAVDLLRESSRDDGDLVRILCLACGDPRNILYTLWCERGFKTQRSYEITTCDHEPAVLARNVILFTLLLDKVGDVDPDEATQAWDTVWNVFYHTSIPESDLRKLQDHAARLAEFSTSTSEWVSSPYGKCISYLSKTTLTSLRYYWLKYAGTKAMSLSERLGFDQDMRASIGKAIQANLGLDLSTNNLRSAGAHCQNAVLPVDRALKEYCKTGVICGNERDGLILGNNGKGFANPTFAFSSSPTKTYACHYATNPLDGFHLAEVYDKFKALNPTLDDAARAAQSQFRLWCHAYFETVRERRIQIILHCGDAINLCYMLQRHNCPDPRYLSLIPLYVGPWTFTPLLLDGPACNASEVHFDVIDTSNLADHLSILNLLPPTVPLLRRRPSSVLYTETLMVRSENQAQWLDTDLCMNTPTMSILMGVSPCGYLFGETPYSNVTEELIVKIDRYHYRVREAWKYPDMGDTKLSTKISAEGGLTSIQQSKTYIDANDLCKILVGQYVTMFGRDDVDGLSIDLDRTLAIGDIRRRGNNRPPLLQKPLYSRFGFAAMLRIAMTNVATDWDACLNLMSDTIQNIETPSVLDVGWHELALYFEAFGLIKSTWTWQRKLAAPDSSSPLACVVKYLQDSNPDIPVVNVVLKIPHEVWEYILLVHETIGNPGLTVVISHPTGEEVLVRSFTSLQCFFGSMLPNAADELLSGVVEDSKGWTDCSDLIVTCPIPTSLLVPIPDDEVTVSLRINNYLSVPSITEHFPDSIIWERPITDTDGVSILAAAPMSEGQAARPGRYEAPQRAEYTTSSCVAAHLNSVAEIKSLCYHDDIPNDSKHSRALANDETVNVHQSSPCTISVRIGTQEPRLLIYPFPVNGAASRTKIARKASWIEVTVPISPAGVKGGFELQPFPMLSTGPETTPWTCPRVNIHQKSVINLNEDLEWLQYHMTSSFTTAEQSIIAGCPRDSPHRPKNGILDFKQTMSLIVTSFAGCNPLTQFTRYKGFGLWLQAPCELVIYIHNLRHDPTTASVFLDAWIIQKEYSPARLPSEEFLPVGISNEELPIWKQFLPSAVERCRIGWSHREDCEYRKTRRIPLSVSRGTSSICSCGQGKAVDDFPKGTSIARLKDRATRAALYPLFATPLSTASGSSLDQVPGQNTTAATHPSSQPQTTEQKCEQCGTVKGGLKKCQRCGKVWYCNHDCQKAAWKKHKKVCNK